MICYPSTLHILSPCGCPIKKKIVEGDYLLYPKAWEQANTSDINSNGKRLNIDFSTILFPFFRIIKQKFHNMEGCAGHFQHNQLAWWYEWNVFSKRVCFIRDQKKCKFEEIKFQFHLPPFLFENWMIVSKYRKNDKFLV